MMKQELFHLSILLNNLNNKKKHHFRNLFCLKVFTAAQSVYMLTVFIIFHLYFILWNPLFFTFVYTTFVFFGWLDLGSTLRSINRLLIKFSLYKAQEMSGKLAFEPEPKQSRTLLNAKKKNASESVEI